MDRVLKLIGVCVLLWSSSAAAHEGSAERGRFKLYLDAALFGLQRDLIVVTYTGNLSSEEFKTTDTHMGPFSGGGIGAGYAVTSYLIPQLYFSLHGNLTNPPSGPESHDVRYNISPQVEFVRPRGTFAPFATVGFAFSGTKVEYPEFVEDNLMGEGKFFRFGPDLSIGFHSFLVPRAALDVSLRFNAGFLMRANGVKFDEPTKNRQFNLLLTMGASFWL